MVRSTSEPDFEDALVRLASLTRLSFAAPAWTRVAVQERMATEAGDRCSVSRRREEARRPRSLSPGNKQSLRDQGGVGSRLPLHSFASPSIFRECRSRSSSAACCAGWLPVRRVEVLRKFQGRKGRHSARSLLRSTFLRAYARSILRGWRGGALRGLRDPKLRSASGP